MTSLNPYLRVGDQIIEPLLIHGKSAAKADAPCKRALDALREVGIQDGREPPQGLSAPVQRRDAPARDDRHGAHHQPGTAHRRRADHRARRDRAGADSRPHQKAPARPRHGGNFHHARPWRRQRILRPGAGDVRRAHRRTFASGGRGVPRAQAPVQPGAPTQHSGDAVQGHGPLYDSRVCRPISPEPISRVPVRTALRVCARGMSTCRCGLEDGRAGARIGVYARPASARFSSRRRRQNVSDAEHIDEAFTEATRSHENIAVIQALPFLPMPTVATDPFLEIAGPQDAFSHREGVSLIKKQVGTVQALSTASTFRLAKGEVLGLVGESGCGKSTLGRTILQLIPPYRRQGRARRPQSGRPQGLATCATRAPGSR